MAPTVDGLRDYLRADPETFQEDMAGVCLAAARGYLEGAECEEDGSDLYCLCCYMLAGHWYLNRGTVVIGVVQGPVAYGVQSIIHLIRTYKDNPDM